MTTVNEAKSIYESELQELLDAAFHIGAVSR